MIEWWGDVVVEYWGGSEGGVVTLVGFGGVARPSRHGRAAVNSRPMGGVRRGRGRPARCRPARLGALWCASTWSRGGGALQSTTATPAKTAAAYREPGVRDAIGDIGYVDAEGYASTSRPIAKPT